MKTEILCTVCKAKNRVDSERLQAARCGKCKASLSSPPKKCRFCAEYIKDEAVKCKHCGEFVSESDRQRIETARSRQAGSGGSGFSSFFEHFFGGQRGGDTHLNHEEEYQKRLAAHVGKPANKYAPLLKDPVLMKPSDKWYDKLFQAQQQRALLGTCPHCSKKITMLDPPERAVSLCPSCFLEVKFDVSHASQPAACPSCHGSGLTRNGVCPGCEGQGMK